MFHILDLISYLSYAKLIHSLFSQLKSYFKPLYRIRPAKKKGHYHEYKRFSYPMYDEKYLGNGVTEWRLKSDKKIQQQLDKLHKEGEDRDENIINFLEWSEGFSIRFFQDFFGPEFEHFPLKTHKKRKICPYDIIKLHEVNISRWIPLIPGTHFQRNNQQIARKISQRVIDIFPEENYLSEQLRISWYKILDGICSIRLLPTENYYLCSATERSVSLAVPILVRKKDFDNFLIESFREYNSVNATISGIIRELPRELNRVWHDKMREANLPNFSIPSLILEVDKIEKVGMPDKIQGHAWTIYGYRNDQLNKTIKTFVEQGFRVDSEESLKRASKQILFTVEKSKNSSLPEYNFDEVKNWFPSSAHWGPSSQYGIVEY